MKLKIVIDRLKAEAPVFEGRVAGAAEFETEVENTDLAVPCAFVIRLADTPGASLTAGEIVQPLDERVGVLVAVSNAGDRRGQDGAEDLDDIRAALWEALLGWAPSDEHGAIQYRGARHLGMNRARLWHQFDFSALAVVSTL
jgi:hypothetical protein